jgi:hypothetical protein
MGCIACEMEAAFAEKRGETPMAQPFPTEAHHLTDRGYRIHSGGHMATLPLEAWHHRGICIEYLTAREMTALYGPSLARSKRNFQATYGSERELLAIIDARLNQTRAA